MQDFYVLDDPLEQHNLYDEMPELVQFLLDKINKDKWSTVQNVFNARDPNTPKNSFLHEGYITAKPNFCSPDADFPVLSVDPKCI